MIKILLWYCDLKVRYHSKREMHHSRQVRDYLQKTIDLLKAKELIEKSSLGGDGHGNKKGGAVVGATAPP